MGCCKSVWFIFERKSLHDFDIAAGPYFQRPARAASGSAMD